MFPGEGFTEEDMYGMTQDDFMAAASMGMPLQEYMQMGLAGWDSSPCGDSTPMSLAGMDASSVQDGSVRSHARGRRARRRKQKPGCNDDGEDSEDGASPTASFSMPDTPLGEVAFITHSNSGSANTSPLLTPSNAGFPTSVETLMSAWETRGNEIRALGPIAADRSNGFTAGGNGQRPRGGSNGKSVGGTPTASENDPGRANAANVSTPSDQPMKVIAGREGHEEDFSRDDFLSLEVGRPWLSAW